VKQAEKILPTPIRFFMNDVLPLTKCYLQKLFLASQHQLKIQNASSIDMKIERHVYAFCMTFMDVGMAQK